MCGQDSTPSRVWAPGTTQVLGSENAPLALPEHSAGDIQSMLTAHLVGVPGHWGVYFTHIAGCWGEQQELPQQSRGEEAASPGL